jgi:hypothetical protein
VLLRVFRWFVEGLAWVGLSYYVPAGVNLTTGNFRSVFFSYSSASGQ